MFSILKRADSDNARIGIHRGRYGLATAELSHGNGDRKPVLTHCKFDQLDQDDEIAPALRRLPHRKYPAVAVLPSSLYSILLVEAPEVPADELRSAVRWRIKDLIDFHIDDAVLDVFEMPSRSHGSATRMMYAVAARAQGVEDEIRFIEQAGLKLKALDILELSLRNVANLLDSESRGVGILHLGEHSGVFLIVRQGILYLARRFDTGVRSLQEAGDNRSAVVDGLALEARRSLDYFESHYEQSAVSVIHTSGLDAGDIDRITAELGISVRDIVLESLFETDIVFDPDLSRRCMPAIGAALRRDEVSL